MRSIPSQARSRTSTDGCAAIILFVASAILGLSAGCGDNSPSNPPQTQPATSAPEAFFVPRGATDAAYSEAPHKQVVVYRLGEGYPANEYLADLDAHMARLGWKPLRHHPQVPLVGPMPQRSWEKASSEDNVPCDFWQGRWVKHHDGSEEVEILEAAIVYDSPGGVRRHYADVSLVIWRGPKVQNAWKSYCDQYTSDRARYYHDAGQAASRHASSRPQAPASEPAPAATPHQR